ELAAMLDARGRSERDFDLIDVREPGEHEIVRIPGSQLISQGHFVSGEALSNLSRDRDIILYCKAGARSAEVLASLRRSGYSRVQHVPGGVLDWVREIDPSLPLY
ncbi:MAG: rhodanese-like domain-containing protein, partial [Cryobacterium sp.]